MTTAAETIAGMNREFEKHFAERDAAGVAGLYTPDARLMPPGFDVMEGRDAVEAFWKGAMDLGITGVSLTSTEVEPNETGAVETGNYALTAADGSELDNGKYLVVWRNDGGTWQLHRDIWNTSRS